ncbi:MAG: UbiX family flavin prenyltransferase [Thermoplasmatota archaeon]
MSTRRIVVALTGASGAGYGLELIRSLDRIRNEGLHLTVIYNDTALSILEKETGADLAQLRKQCDELVHAGKMDHGLASGSNHFDSLVICPCSTSTSAKVHAGISDNLTTRCASVALKERRKLILVVRETPLSTPVLKALFDLSSWGAIVMPASPPFYNIHSDSVKDLQAAFSGRVMDLLGIENDSAVRYDPGSW